MPAEHDPPVKPVSPCKNGHNSLEESAYGPCLFVREGKIVHLAVKGQDTNTVAAINEGEYGCFHQAMPREPVPVNTIDFRSRF